MAVDPKRWGVIYNPKAGSRSAQKRWCEIRSYMEQKQVKFDFVQSEGFGSVERLACTMANNGYRIIVVVGGDGAINDAVNGILHSDAERKGEIALGIIPNGIGNDFAKYWGLDANDYKGAVDTLIHHRIRKVDVGEFKYKVNGELKTRYFINAVYMGLAARIVRITDGTKRFWGIPLISYISSLILVAFERKLYRMNFNIGDEQIKGSIMAVAIGSARGYGLTPNAVPYNGLLDVSVIYRPELRQLIEGLWMLQRGRLLNHKTVKPYRTRTIRLTNTENAEISLDGRILQEKHFPVEICVNPEALTLIIPK